MNNAPFPLDEILRIRELSRYSVIPEEKEEIFCNLAQIATISSSMPLGGVSLVYKNNIWLKGSVGTELSCLVREGAFCSHAVESNENIFIVSDTLKDPRFVNNPLVTSEPHIRFYAAANLIGRRGYNLGTIWVMDTQPRELDDKQHKLMLALAGQVVHLLEMRYQNSCSGLPNRDAFVSNLQCELDQLAGNQPCQRTNCSGHAPHGTCLNEENDEKTKHCVIGCIKIHNLHLVNTVYGSETGQELMRRLATTLGEWAGQYNLLAHLENDDIAFALFNGSDAAELLEGLRHILSLPIEIHGNLIRLATSIGISRFPDSGLNASSLLDQAATAANHSIPLPSTVLTFFDKQVIQTVHDTGFANSLPLNIKERHFVPYYQPQVDIATGTVVGFEALARLRTPGKELIGPEQFIRLAERSGLIGEIDILIFDQVCKDLRHWLDEGLAVVPVAVNLSRLTLTLPYLLQTLRKKLEIYRISTDLIELEITESGFSEDPELVKQRNLEMRNMGFKVSIDDFGTGQSNLSALKDLHFERLKVDRLYIHGASTNIHIGGILRFIKGIGEVFNAEIVSEGIEAQEDLDWISSLGCTLFQGWYFSKALPPENIPGLLRRLAQHYRSTSAPRKFKSPKALAKFLQSA